MAGFVGLVIRLVVWTPLLILMPGCVGIFTGYTKIFKK